MEKKWVMWIGIAVVGWFLYRAYMVNQAKGKVQA